MLGIFKFYFGKELETFAKERTILGKSNETGKAKLLIEPANYVLNSIEDSLKISIVFQKKREYKLPDYLDKIKDETLKSCLVSSPTGV